MHLVDTVVVEVAQPVLKPFGYRRRHRSFWRDGPAGKVAAIEFYRDDYADAPGFGFQYGVVIPALIEWRASRGVEPFTPPSASGSAIVFKQVFHPPYQPGTGDTELFVYRWRADLASPAGSVERAVQTALEAEVIPQLEAWFDASNLATELEDERPGVFPGTTPGRALALALLETAPSPRLDAALAALEDEDPVRIWIEQRL
jgi:hypothetical protein